MNVKRIVIILLAVFTVSAVTVAEILRNTPDQDFDIVAINDIVETLSKHWADIRHGDISSVNRLEYRLQYAILDVNGTTLVVTGDNISDNINTAIRHRDVVVDITANGKILGKAIFYNDIGDIMKRQRRDLLFCILFTFTLIGSICAIYALHLNRVIFKPFHNLQIFARHVAAGNLDLPLKMDRDNLFGAFTEGFDIMREELKKARENEMKAEKSKKELVASLSHDIKTPVASIKAVTEIMHIKSCNSWEKEQLEIVNAKAGQIDLLISNMFHATLEELEELKVSVTEIESTFLYELIKNADYNSRAGTFTIPECIILGDPLRLQQIFDNIFSNSYKYANTEIEISSYLLNGSLVVDIADFGTGVSTDEIPLLCEKFFRGKNAQGKNGSGLGLYISKYFMICLNGNIECIGNGAGLCVRLFLALV